MLAEKTTYCCMVNARFGLIWLMLDYTTVYTVQYKRWCRCVATGSYPLYLFIPDLSYFDC